MDHLSRTATAHALAGSLLSLLTWWLDHNMPITPELAEEIFHRMAPREAFRESNNIPFMSG
jgi:hypothetical protein